MSRWACGCLVEVFPVTVESERIVCPSCCYRSVPPRTVATLKFRKVEESNQMSTTRTLEITIPDGYTEAEVREHLAKLPVKVKEPWRVARDAFDPWGVTERTPNEIRRWTNVVNACREGYVEKDKIEAALVERVAVSLNADREFKDGFYHGWHNLARLIREAMK